MKIIERKPTIDSKLLATMAGNPCPFGRACKVLSMECKNCTFSMFDIPRDNSPRFKVACCGTTAMVARHMERMKLFKNLNN